MKYNNRPLYSPRYSLRYSRCSGVVGLMAALLLAGCAGNAVQSEAPPAAATSAHVNHAAHAPAKDELGRQLYGMSHDMSPAVITELREREVIPAYMTDEEVARMMRSMGSNYVWYVSPADVAGSRGILVLAHGFGRQGDMAMRRRLDPVGQAQPAAMALGMSMAMSNHIQLALDDLTAAGATEIAVIPVVSSRYSTLMRQWDFIFGLQDEPEYATVPRVTSTAELHFAAPMEAHPFVREILSEYAAEISKDKPQEEIIIVAHGPLDAADNAAQLQMLAGLAESLRAEGYAGVFPVTLQDDAPKEVRQANVQHMREIVGEIEARGHVPMVITNLIGTRMVQSSIRKDLSGLGYRYNFRGLVQHEKFVEWVQLAADEAFKASP
jgi:hypothetical protein